MLTALEKMDDLIRQCLDLKLDKKTFWIILIPFISIVVAAIGNLYMLYYSGLSEIQSDLAVIKIEIQYIKDDLKTFCPDVK